MTTIADIQGSIDQRNVPIRRVGIKDLTHPAQLRMRDGKSMSTVATFSVYASLPAQQKGTHMSRFVTLLNEKAIYLSLADVSEMAIRVSDLLGAEDSYVLARFPFFILKSAPVSKQKSWMDYHAGICASLNGSEMVRYLQVSVPVKSLCPCSKKISEFGAHNQRSEIKMKVWVNDDRAMEPEQLVDIAEELASCPLYSLLKRPDEKYVTERAYSNPKFVEDIVRDIALVLRDLDQVGKFEVEVENFESIHNHSAYAKIVSDDLS